MSKIEEYRRQLTALEDWEPFLLENSGLPGPRGNIELANAVADEGNRSQFEQYLSFTADRAPTNDPREFLAFCGVLGHGRMLAEGDREALPILKAHASDPRWRIREAVAMALQRWGQVDMDALLAEMALWSRGGFFEMRAAAAGLCEPRLLTNVDHSTRVLERLDEITTLLTEIEDRKSEAFLALRKGLGYCWSVAVAANPVKGKTALERWFKSNDKDVRWIMKENLRKKRLERMDPDWVVQAVGMLQRP